jgi:TRAP-type C4-dicarboxylate transport system substrate-binding protein
MYDPMVFYVNTNWLNSLPEDLRTAVQEAAMEAAVYQRELVTKQEAAAEKELQEKWNVSFTHPDLAPFREACASVYDSYAYPDNLKLIQDALKQ